MNKPSLLLVGCGNMGGALVSAWIKADLFDITILSPSLTQGAYDATITNDARNLAGQRYDIVVLAVKPQKLQDALLPLQDVMTQDTLIISVLAGSSIDNINMVLNKSNPVIRVMPNTPAAIGHGASAGFPGTGVTETHKDYAQRMFTQVGLFLWAHSEDEIDAITALSGGGPAFLYYFTEALSKAGETIGLSRDVSLALARQTMIGSAYLAGEEKDIPLEKLRQNVTSPGGTTQAGLEILMDGQLQDILSETLKAAHKRAKDLNK